MIKCNRYSCGKITNSCREGEKPKFMDINESEDFFLWGSKRIDFFKIQSFTKLLFQDIYKQINLQNRN